MKYIHPSGKIQSAPLQAALRGKSCNIIERLFARFHAIARPGARPGLILFVQTFGDLVNFNPHIHLLAADGILSA